MNHSIIAFLEELMDLRRAVWLRFRGDNGGVITLQAKITDLELDGPEPALLADGVIRIPLHRLLYINDRPVQALA